MNSSDFTTILHDTQAAIRLHIALRGIPPTDVDDVAQDVYMAFFKAQDRRPSEVEPIRWLKGIANNHCMRWFRSHARIGHFLIELNELVAHVPSSFEHHEEDERVSALRTCLATLSDPSRALLERYYADDAAPERSTSAVRMSVLRLRDALRQCINGRLQRAGA